MVIPGGAHVESLKKGDIVFSAAQTQELIKYGKVMSGNGYGHVAHADGTAYNMMNAHAANSGKFVGGASSTSSSSSGSSSTSSDNNSSGSTTVVNNYNYTGTGSGSTTNNYGTGDGGTTSNAEDAIETFEDWLGTIFDWVEVRLERLTDKIQNYVQKAENALNSRNYNGAASSYRSALSGTVTQITQEDKAYTKYMNEVDTILRKAADAGIMSADSINVLKKQMKNGQLAIEEYNEHMQKVISSAQEW